MGVMRQQSEATRALVLLGGGHAHLGVLRALGMRPEPGLQVTLLTRETMATYSGMVPGVVAGLHPPGSATLDVRELARQAGVRLVHAEAEGLDLPARRVLLRGRPPLRFDFLSVDVGAAPRLDVPGAAEHALAVWPLDGMLARIDAAVAAGVSSVAVVGGGAGGVELALALRTRLGPGAAIALVAGTLLPGHGALSRRLTAALLRERDITMLPGPVERVSAGRLQLAGGAGHAAGLILWATGAAPIPWLRASGLALDERGFMAVLPTLQSISHPMVFGAGDCATVLAHVRPKAGVYAVRQGPPLAENLRRVARGEAALPFTPQRRALFLLNGADGSAIASYGALAARGGWAWRWKRRIDLRWMAKLRMALPLMRPVVAEAVEMRCAGCAAKVPGGVLARVLARLGPARAPEDAARLDLPAGLAVLQTVDMFPAPVADPWLAGRIAAAHALGDLHASGARPVAALAIASLPVAAPALLEEELFQLLHGAGSVLGPAGAPLLGGHTAEGAELALGFALTGVSEAPLGKAGLRVGDALVLTKPLGTGVVLAGAMRGLAPAPWVEATLAAMQRDAGAAAAVLRAHGASACTDVTGFGLAGHLGEMLAASHVAARLGDVPALPGALALLGQGVRSTAHAGNAGYAAPWVGGAEVPALWLDPQTSGPLLAGVPAGQAAACVAALHAAGQGGAAIVGNVTMPGPGPALAQVVEAAT